MNQEKIGKFISELRKEKNMTQEQLADKLGISNKSISRWENGKTMPDYSLLNDICNEFNITINELLSGERIEKENYISKAEENLISLKRRIDIIHKIVNKTERIAFRICFIIMIVCVLLKLSHIDISNYTFLENLVKIIRWIGLESLLILFVLEVFVYEDDEK